VDDILWNSRPDLELWIENNNNNNNNNNNKVLLIDYLMWS
jgi:hypothetical protein